MAVLDEFFRLNRPLVLFVYGQTFFILGLAIFLQSRRHSRLRLARDLRWLAAFGILHGAHEWGDVFIPIQAAYLPKPYVELLLTVHTLLLALSFTCLLIFGAVTLDERWPWLIKLVLAVAALWGILFWVTLYTTPTVEAWWTLSSIWARYLLGLPGSLLAAYGLRYQAKTSVAPLGGFTIYRMLRVAGVALAVYAFLGGVIVRPADFFPANVFNANTVAALVGIPIEVFRSVAGLVLAVSMIRALEVFEIEVDQLIESMEVERIQTAERDRIGQEIHDGAIQAVYSASLLLESMVPHVEEHEELAVRLDRAQRVLNGAISDLRRYMVSLRSDTPREPLAASLRALVSDPRYSSLIRIQLKFEVEPDLKPIQVSHALAIVQECLSNAVRHAHARHVTISTAPDTTGLLLRIEDDGQGFDEKTAPTGFGLRAMRDRARLLGSQLHVQSRPGKGVTISVLIPEEGLNNV